MAEQGTPQQASSAMFTMILMMGFMFILVFVPEIRDTIGTVLGYVLQPTIGFGFKYPILSILCAGFLTTIISTLIRHFMTDWVKMGRDQYIQKTLSSELRQAQKDNNLYKMKKLQEVQTERMAMQSTGMIDQMKPMMFTMFIFIGIFTWLREFLYSPQTYEFGAFGWNPHFYLFDNFLIFPHYILIYMLVSISFGQLLQNLGRILIIKSRMLLQERNLLLN